MLRLLQRPPCLAGLLVAAVLSAPPAAAQTAASDPLVPILGAAADTPGGDGLLAVALAEAWVALEQARLAVAGDDLAAIQRHARGVLHAVDPSRTSGGPGAGYGVRRAVAGMTAPLEAVVATTDHAGAGRLAPRAVAALAHVRAWADALVPAAERAAAAGSVDEAQAATGTLLALARQLTFGRGGEGQGRAAFGSGEPGLLAVRTALRALAAHGAAQAVVEARR